MTTAEPRPDAPPLFVLWMDFLEWLFPVTEKFPKSARHPFTSRIEGLALDLMEDILEARYSASKAGALGRINLKLDKLRVLVRLAYRRRFLAEKGYEHASRRLDEAGRMAGGWLKHAKAGVGPPIPRVETAP